MFNAAQSLAGMAFRKSRRIHLRPRALSLGTASDVRPRGGRAETVPRAL